VSNTLVSPLDPKEFATLEGLDLSNLWELAALVEVLE